MLSTRLTGATRRLVVSHCGGASPSRPACLLKTCSGSTGTPRSFAGAGARRAKSASTSGASSTTSTSTNANAPLTLVWAIAAASFGVGAAAASTKTYCEKRPEAVELLSTPPMLGVMAKEPSTGILFPLLCNGMTLVGCGVRFKYGLVKVYAVGTYVDVVAVQPLKSLSKAQLEEKLANDVMALPRTIRIVMNRKLSTEKFTAAIVEALEPRMKGKDLEKLEEFKKLNPPVDMEMGSEMEITIRGNTLLYRNAIGGIGSITSEVFCQAMCDVFYGQKAVSPSHRDAVVKGIQAM